MNLFIYLKLISFEVLIPGENKKKTRVLRAAKMRTVVEHETRFLSNKTRTHTLLVCFNITK